MKDRPAVITTVLGSCVSVSLYHPLTRTGGMCHAMLPGGAGQSGGKYVDRAMALMLEWFDRRGIPRRELEVKLFGGADMFEVDPRMNREKTVGKQNIAAAQVFLGRCSLPVKASDVGGDRGRKLIFLPHTGEVFMKCLNKGMPVA